MANSTVELRFNYEDFDEMDIPNLMVNIWHYSDMHQEKYCVICSTYRNCCVTALKKTWKDRYINFDFVVEKLCQRDKKWEDVSKITVENMSKFYRLIEGKTFK